MSATSAGAWRSSNEACIANATGLVPDVPGMHGPAADRDQMVKVLIPKEDGGVLNRKGVVDFARDVSGVVRRPIVLWTLLLFLSLATAFALTSGERR